MFLGFFSLHSAKAIADIISAEATKLTNLADSIEYFAEDHGNRLPSSWQELDAYTSSKSYGTVRELDHSYGGGKLTDNYSFVSSAAFSKQLSGAQVIVIGRKEIDDAGDKGRFVISRPQKGKVECGFYTEEEIHKIIAETHIVVPPPPKTN